jgi:hypothetical protein
MPLGVQMESGKENLAPSTLRETRPASGAACNPIAAKSHRTVHSPMRETHLVSRSPR